jgi:2-polyprenyl-3-methyl-5-hydroxy-6-metoxy-1,4-benzoquinol methylase
MLDTHAVSIDGSDVQPSPQSSVDDYFADQSGFWRDIYGSPDVYALIHQERRAQVLAWVEALNLPCGSRVLDVGCGAGLTATALAQRGLQVHATDSVPAMVELARRHATEAGVGHHVELATADVHELPFDEGTFELVVALGVIPWLHSPRTAVHEIARVTRPGGYVILNSDNPRRLNHALDPRFNARLDRVREAAKGLLRRLDRLKRPVGVVPSLHSPREFDALLRSADLCKREARTLGFGPFTFLGRLLLPRALGVKVHGRLQTRADRGSRKLRYRGSQYLVVTKKAASLT